MPIEIFYVFLFSLGCLTQRRLWLSTMFQLAKRWESEDDYYSVMSANLFNALTASFCPVWLTLLGLVQKRFSPFAIACSFHKVASLILVTIAWMQVKEAIFATLIRNGMFDNSHIRLSLTRGKKVYSLLRMLGTLLFQN